MTVIELKLVLDKLPSESSISLLIKNKDFEWSYKDLKSVNFEDGNVILCSEIP